MRIKSSFKYFLLLNGLLILIFLYFKADFISKNYRETAEYVLDTYVTLKIYDDKVDFEDAQVSTFQLLRKKEKVFNFYDPDSELSIINESLKRSGKAEVNNPDLLKVIKLSLQIARDTEGAFDPTVGKLVRLWAFDRGGKLPKSSEIKDTLRTVGWFNLQIQNRTVESSTPLEIDLGGISKGYCLDLAAKELKKLGCKKFLLNSVSSTIVFNEIDESPFKIGIEDPRKKGIFALVFARDGETISTSADNQKFFTYRGKKYHHILNPKTGYPASGFISLTVVAKKSAAETDALSTALFVMGPEKAIQFAKKHGLKIVGITGDGKVIIHPRGGWVKILDD